MSDEVSVIVDAGSKSIKVGFAGESFPRNIIPSVVGRFRREGLTDGVPDIYFGGEAIKKKGISNLSWPIEGGMVQDWDEMEKLWHHLFYRELLVAPEISPTLIALHPLTKLRDKEKLAEILFESFLIKDLYLAISPALVLHASGRTTGVVWENGYSCNYTAPVFEGFPLKHATICSELNGKLLTERLQYLLKQVGYSFTTPCEIESVDKLKEQLCFTTTDYELELAKASSKEKVPFKLPDGQQVLIGDERFLCPEVLLQPSLHGLRIPSVVDNIRSSISKSDLDYKGEFYNNIVLSGGSTMFEGLPDRLFIELRKRASDSYEMRAKIDAMPSRHLAAWIGGSIVASLSSYDNFWMSRQEYEDGGADKVRYKFF
ncbi:actin-104-like [Pieris napi]|uniref:actin-104-like n=1 Tax=Pieris napi TaxID=78633 RepID=UPI001FBBEC2D|nr:actin-104-like [Pieris napi]